MQATTVRTWLNRIGQFVGCVMLLATSSAYALEIAGELLVNFDASALTPGTPINTLEAVRNFTAEGNPTVDAYTTNGVTVTGLTFDGIDDYLVSPSAETNRVINQPFTVETWVFNPATSSDNGAESIFSWSAETNDNTLGACLTYNGAGQVGWLGKHSVPFYNGMSPIPGQWHALTLTYSGGSSVFWESGILMVYVDGVLNRWIPATQEINEIYRWFDRGIYTIGARISTNETPTAFFSGALARLRFHSGALSPQQVRANYETERSAFPVYDANRITALENPGDVVLDMDATGLSDGALASWSGNSTQTLTQATTAARPTVGTIKGVKAVTFDGNDWLDVAGVDSRLLGSTVPFTVETYIYNPTIENEESYFCWAPRGNSGATWDGKCRSLSYGSNSGYGSVGFWKSAWEMGFSTIPAATTWHHLVTTYDGVTMNVYVDGFLNTSKAMTPNATTNFVYSIGRASSLDGTSIKWFSGSIARLRICTGALTAQQVYRNTVYLNHMFASGSDIVIENAYGNGTYSSVTNIGGSGDYTFTSIHLAAGAALNIATNTIAGQIGLTDTATMSVNSNTTLTLTDRILVGGGSTTPSPSTLTVSGAIKSLFATARYALAVGLSGTGQMTINPKASVNIGSASEIWVGSGSNAIGTLTIKGGITNSAWFLIGRYGGSGSVTVDGGNLTCNGNLQLGEITDTARLILTNGATAFFTQANIGVWGGSGAIDVSRNSQLTINGILMNYMKFSTGDWGAASIRLTDSTLALGAGGITTKTTYNDAFRDFWMAPHLPIEITLSNSTLQATANTRICVPLGLQGSNTFQTSGKTLTLRDTLYGDSFTASNSVLEMTPKNALRQDVTLNASTLTIDNTPYRWCADSLSVAHGVAVTAWSDDHYESGAARIGTGPLMVTNAINGHRALRFNTDTLRQLRIPSRLNPLAGAEAATIAVVFKPYGYGFASGPYSWWNSTLFLGGEYSGSANDWGFIFGQDGRIGLALSQVAAEGAMDIVQYHATPASLNAPHIALCSWQPGHVALNLDGDETLNPTLYPTKGVSESNGALPNTLEGVSLPRSTYPIFIGDGKGTQAACLNGEIAEIRIYRNQYMDRVARQKLVQDLATSYGLTTIASAAAAATTNATYAADLAAQNACTNNALPAAAALWSADTLQATDGATISTWPDAVSARMATGMATYSGSGIGGRPALQFASSPMTVASVNNPLTGAQQLTAALVFQANTSFASSSVNWWEGGGLLGNKTSAFTNNNDWGLALVNGRIVAGAGAQVAKSYNYTANYTVSMVAKSKPQLADGKPHVAIYRWSNSGAHAVSIDGITLNLDSVGYARTAQPLLIGGTQNANGFVGLIAEVRLYTNRLTDAQEAILGSELAAKYNAYPTAYRASGMLPGKRLVLNASTFNISTNYCDPALSTLASNQTLVANGSTSIKGVLCVGNHGTLVVPSTTDSVTIHSLALQSGATLAWKFAGQQSAPIQIADDLALPAQLTLDLSGSTGKLGHATTLMECSGTLTQPVHGTAVTVIGATQPGTKVIVLANEKRVLIQPPQGTIMIVQ